MASPFKNILIIGATGSIGSTVLSALLAEPSFTVTALQRSSSKSKVAQKVKVATIDEPYSLDSLISVFSGQDAVINCMSSLSVSDQIQFIDAAAAAKVKRYIASEYGLNNNRPDARALNSIFHDKGEIQDYLRSKESTGLEWMSVSCGMWLKWSATHNFLGMHIKQKKFVFYDDGEGWISTTTEENTALAIVNALTKKWEQTRNRTLWLSDFAITQKTLLETIERLSGDKYTTETVDSRSFIKEKQAAVAAGDPYAVYALLEVGFATGRFGGHLEKEGEIMNELLGLPKKSLDEVVKAALEAVKTR
ncbi:Fc.00g025810.m01.CDS01 [Cosmosporella sp. VM-42]